MAAPKNPSTAAAHAARRHIGDEKAAQRLRDAGWIVVPVYTVRIEASNAEQSIWQVVDPGNETVHFDGTAQQLADWTASNQTVVDGDGWRVCVWRGKDADTTGVPTAMARPAIGMRAGLSYPEGIMPA